MRRRPHARLLAVVLAIQASAAYGNASRDPSPAAGVERCATFVPNPARPPADEAAALADRLLKLPDAPTVLTGVESVAAAGDQPAYCGFRGTTASHVQFEIRLPLDGWNGKLLMQGCGGMCGWINMGATEDSLARRYAVVNTDMGHASPPNVALWAFDDRDAELDFAYRSTWTTAQVARALVETFYRSPPARSYFNGCSTGGRQGMVAAQRFPELFDGIVAGAPVFNQTGTGLLHLLWSARANVGDDGRPILSTAKLAKVHERVLAACDRMDGVDDGIVPDPRACGFRPESMACRAGADGDGCLTAAELGALDRLYRGARNADGMLDVAGGGGLPLGSEYAWSPVFVNVEGQHGLIHAQPGLVDQLVQFQTFYLDPGPSASKQDFDFDRDVSRLALVESFYNAQNPDLRRYAARGGKLLLYHGWDDTEVPPGYSVDYYETATRTMGGPDRTREFFRLFMVPGMGHCRRGVGADGIDPLTALERWVEHGEAPDHLLAHKLVKEQSYLGLPRLRFPLAADAYQWRRPVYAYPDVAVWTGRGDWKDPSQWRPARPKPVASR